MRLQDVLRGRPDQVVILPPKASLSQASALMMLERVGAILVCEGGRILGILSERDLAVAIAVRGPELFGLCVSELMSVNVPRAAPSDAVSDVMRTMTEKRARHVPVVDGEAVLGLVSLGDVRLAEKIQESAALQDLARARLEVLVEAARSFCNVRPASM
jgi:CBS domain-containing protein